MVQDLHHSQGNVLKQGRGIEKEAGALPVCQSSGPQRRASELPCQSGSCTAPGPGSLGRRWQGDSARGSTSLRGTYPASRWHACPSPARMTCSVSSADLLGPSEVPSCEWVQVSQETPHHAGNQMQGMLHIQSCCSVSGRPAREAL